MFVSVIEKSAVPLKRAPLLLTAIENVTASPGFAEPGEAVMPVGLSWAWAAVLMNSTAPRPIKNRSQGFMLVPRRGWRWSGRGDYFFAGLEGWVGVVVPSM